MITGPPDRGPPGPPPGGAGASEPAAVPASGSSQIWSRLREPLESAASGRENGGGVPGHSEVHK